MDAVHLSLSAAVPYIDTHADTLAPSEISGEACKPNRESLKMYASQPDRIIIKLGQI